MWSVFKVDKHKRQVFQEKIGVAKRRMRLDMLEIYRLKEGFIAEILIFGALHLIVFFELI